MEIDATAGWLHAGRPRGPVGCTITGEETGIRVEHDRDQPAVLVDVVDHPLPDGTTAASFGAAYAFTADATRTLRPEAGQPAAWWPLESPPSEVSEPQWARLQDRLFSR